MQNNLLICLVTTESNSGFTITYFWLGSDVMLLAYWPVCKFDLILVVPSALTSITDRHLPLFQCITIASQMFMLSVSFVVPLYNVTLLIG